MTGRRANSISSSDEKNRKRGGVFSTLPPAFDDHEDVSIPLNESVHEAEVSYSDQEPLVRRRGTSSFAFSLTERNRGASLSTSPPTNQGDVSTSFIRGHANSFSCYSEEPEENRPLSPVIMRRHANSVSLPQRSLGSRVSSPPLLKRYGNFSSLNRKTYEDKATSPILREGANSSSLARRNDISPSDEEPFVRKRGASFTLARMDEGVHANGMTISTNSSENELFIRRDETFLRGRENRSSTIASSGVIISMENSIEKSDFFKRCHRGLIPNIFNLLHSVVFVGLPVGALAYKSDQTNFFSTWWPVAITFLVNVFFQYHFNIEFQKRFSNTFLNNTDNKVTKSIQWLFYASMAVLPSCPIYDMGREAGQIFAGDNKFLAPILKQVFGSGLGISGVITRMFGLEAFFQSMSQFAVSYRLSEKEYYRRLLVQQILQDENFWYLVARKDFEKGKLSEVSIYEICNQIKADLPYCQKLKYKIYSVFNLFISPVFSSTGLIAYFVWKDIARRSLEVLLGSWGVSSGGNFLSGLAGVVNAIFYIKVISEIFKLNTEFLYLAIIAKTRNHWCKAGAILLPFFIFVITYQSGAAFRNEVDEMTREKPRGYYFHFMEQIVKELCHIDILPASAQTAAAFVNDAALIGCFSSILNRLRQKGFLQLWQESIPLNNNYIGVTEEGCEIFEKVMKSDLIEMVHSLSSRSVAEIKNKFPNEKLFLAWGPFRLSCFNIPRPRSMSHRGGSISTFDREEDYCTPLLVREDVSNASSRVMLTSYSSLLNRD